MGAPHGQTLREDRGLFVSSPVKLSSEAQNFKGLEKDFTDRGTLVTP